MFLREKSTIAAAKALLERVHHSTTILHGNPPNADGFTVNVRVFLAMYMIALRPSHVFEDLDTLARSLLDAAKRLLQCFESIISQILERNLTVFCVDLNLRSEFASLLFDYLAKFKAWKIPDETKLTCRIKHALIALYGAEAQLPADEPEDSNLRVELRTQIERLRTKLEQIAGIGAVNDFDIQRMTFNRAVDPAIVCNIQSRNIPVFSRPASNQQLAHELLLNPAFQLELDNICDTSAARIRQSFEQAFWDSLVDDLTATPPCYFRVLRLMREFRDGLAEVGCNAGRIDEVLDLQLMRDRLAADAFSWPDVIALVSSIVAIVKPTQSPARDADTCTKWLQVRQQMVGAQVADQPSLFTKALKFLLSLLSNARVDAANARFFFKNDFFFIKII